MDSKSLMTEYVVLIGGGKSQLPFISAAIGLGYKTIVFDRDINCPGAELSDLFYAVSIRNVDELVSKCLKVSESHPICGVMTYSSHESPLRASALICNQLGLPSFSPSSIENVLDKNLMKSCFAKYDILTPDWLLTSDKSMATEFHSQLSSRVILKPSSGGVGSAGVSLIEKNNQGIEDKFQQAKDSSSDGFVIIEKFVKGQEYSVDGIVIKDKPHTLSISEKHNLGPEKGFVMSGFSTLNRYTNKTSNGLWSMIEGVAHSAVSALGLRNSLFSADVVVEDGVVVVIECGVLLDCKIDRLLWFAGIDIYEMYIRLITGTYRNSVSSVVKDVDLRFLFAERQGMLEIKEDVFDYVSLEWEKKDGDCVKPPASISDTVGWVIGQKENVSSLTNSNIQLFEIQ